MNLSIKSLVKSIVTLVILGAALILIQMWFELFESELFVKLLVTLFIVGGVVSFIIAVKKDMSEEKKLKDDNYIN